MTAVWQTRPFKAIHLDFNSDREQQLDLHLRASYVILQVLDFFLTIFAMTIGMAELNPLMNSLLASPAQLLSFKLALPLIIAWFIPGKLLIPAIIFLAMVVGWDIKELLVLFL